MKDMYWFLKDGKSLCDQLESHHATWLQYGSNLMAQCWLRNSIAYYSTIIEPNDWQSSLAYTGDQGELVRMVVPQARSLLRQTVALVTKQRLYFRAIAESVDSDVMEATKLGNALCEQVVHDQKLDKKREFNVESTGIYGMAFYKVTWRTDKGTPYLGTMDKYTDDDGQEIETPLVHYDGDIEISTPTIYEVYWDSRVTDWDNLNWVEVRTIKNRWDMIASYPALREEILGVPKIQEAQTLQASQAIAVENEDLIYVYECYHKPTPAIPKGRMICYSDPKTIYYDGINHYDCIPIVPLVPEPVIGMGYGYPSINNLLPAQELFDHSLSAIATNQSALAVQNVLCPRQANIGVNQVNGVNWIYYDMASPSGGGEPKALQLVQSAPETFKFADIMKQNMLELSGINSAVRGAPPPGVTSGTAIATLTANALEFMNSLSKSDQLALEAVMELCLECYAKFTTVPRDVSVMGRGNQTFSKSFVGNDLKSVKKVRILTSNPLMNTIGGRADVAEKMLQAGMIKNMQAYFQILEGAPPEVMYENELSEEDLILRENEALMDGRPVMVIKTDDHPSHILCHKKLLNDPQVRLNNDKVQAILNHMQEHEDLENSMDPAFKAMLRTGKAPQGMPPPPGGPPPGSPPPGGPPTPEHGVLPPGARGEILPTAPAGGEGPKPALPTQDLLRGVR